MKSLHSILFPTYWRVKGDDPDSVVRQADCKEATPLFSWGNSTERHTHDVTRHLLALRVLVQLSSLQNKSYTSYTFTILYGRDIYESVSSVIPYLIGLQCTLTNHKIMHQQLYNYTDTHFQLFLELMERPYFWHWFFWNQSSLILIDSTISTLIRFFINWTHWAISRSSQCSTTGVTRTLAVNWKE